MAETYHVFDWRSLPLRTAAVLACGLRPDSRVMLKLAGQRVDQQTLLLASCVDRLSILAWQNTSDGQHGRNMPKSIVQTLLDPVKEEKLKTFKTAADFDAAFNRLVGGQ